jgi:hypothetical protein
MERARGKRTKMTDNIEDKRQIQRVKLEDCDVMGRWDGRRERGV